MTLRWQCICVDSTDPSRVAHFWEAALGWRRTERLEALGARRISVGQGAESTWVVLADPDGNEFCVLRPLTPLERAEDSGVTA